MKLIVLNIPRNIKSEEILALFVPFGVVESCNLVMDEARECIKALALLKCRCGRGERRNCRFAWQASWQPKNLCENGGIIAVP